MMKVRGNGTDRRAKGRSRRSPEGPTDAAASVRGEEGAASSGEPEGEAEPGGDDESFDDDDVPPEDLLEDEEEDDSLTGEVVSGVPAPDEDDEEPDVPVAGFSKVSPSTRSLAVFDPLTAYIQETRRYPLLSREEEHALAVEYRESGDLKAARRLMTANLRLVVKIAHEHRKDHQNLLDLIQEGNVGLVQAVQKYDPYRGVKLSTYAAWWIKAYIRKFILNNSRMVKIGTTQAQRKLFYNLHKQQKALEKEGLPVTAANIAEGLNVTETEVVEMQRRLAAPDLSLSTPLGKDEGGGRTYYDVLAEDEEPPDEQVAGDQFRDILRSKLDAFAFGLRGREEVIYRERLMSDTPLTLKQIGDQWNVSRERARQLEKRLLSRLREYLRQEMGDAVEIAMGWEN